MGIYLTTKHNLLGTAAPGSSDDRASDYTEGSRWINVLTGIEYVRFQAASMEQAA